MIFVKIDQSGKTQSLPQAGLCDHDSSQMMWMPKMDQNGTSVNSDDAGHDLK